MSTHTKPPLSLTQHNFAVVRSAGSSVYNYKNPIWRDVVSTGSPDANDNVTIRFRTDNPGPWFLHCHIDFHLEAGFAGIFSEDMPDIADTNTPPSESILLPTPSCRPRPDLHSPQLLGRTCARRTTRFTLTATATKRTAASHRRNAPHSLRTITSPHLTPWDWLARTFFHFSITYSTYLLRGFFGTFFQPGRA